MSSPLTSRLPAAAHHVGTGCAAVASLACFFRAQGQLALWEVKEKESCSNGQGVTVLRINHACSQWHGIAQHAQRQASVSVLVVKGR